MSLSARISWVIAGRAAPYAKMLGRLMGLIRDSGIFSIGDAREAEPSFPANSRLFGAKRLSNLHWLVICLDTLAARVPLPVAPRRRLFTYTPVASAQLQRRRGGGGFGLLRLAAAGDSLARG